MERGTAVLGRVAAACAGAGGPRERLEEALAELEPLVPFVAALVASSVGDGQRHLAGQGYDDALAGWLRSPATARDIVDTGCLRHRLPVRWRDLPGDPRELRTVGEWLAPAGYREGCTVALVTRDGRHAGTLHLSVDDVRHPDDDARDVIAAAAACLAEVCDEALTGPAHLRVADLVARFRPDTGVTDEDGRPIRLDDRVLAAVHRLHRDGGGAGLVRGGAGRIRVRLLPGVRRGGAAMVLLDHEPELHGLSDRELDVLGLLADGLSNARIAARLSIAPRTVATHVEHVLAKLRVPSRAAAAARAATEGLRHL